MITSEVWEKTAEEGGGEEDEDGIKGVEFRRVIVFKNL